MGRPPREELEVETVRRAEGSTVDMETRGTTSIQMTPVGAGSRVGSPGAGSFVRALVLSVRSGGRN